MRAMLFFAMLMSAGCATEHVATPREYLDESSASTITIVANPWILTRSGAPPQLDLLHLYAVDVNQTGRHGRYLAMIQYWPAAASTHGERVGLVLNLGEGQKRLEALTDDARQLGVGQPLDATAPTSAKTWFYPLDDATLVALASTPALSAELIGQSVSASYVSWRDGSADVKEFASAIKSDAKRQ
jgi:hypothetical protein